MTPIEKYIAEQPEKFRNNLSALRTIILSEVPDAEEIISYQVSVFKKRKQFAGMGVTKTHISFYTMNSKFLAKMKEQWTELNFKVSTVYFKPDEVIPTEIVRAIIKQKLIENERSILNKNCK